MGDRGDAGVGEAPSEAVGQIELLRTLAHEIRLHILGVLSYREVSPAELARERGEPVTKVAYHFRLLQQLGCVEVVRTRQVRGSVEHYYRLKGREERRLDWTPVRLDAAGWAELTALLAATFAEVAGIESRAAARLDSNGHAAEALPGTVVLASFETPLKPSRAAPPS